MASNAAENFLPEICSELQYYVYRLCDPLDGSTFYVGKGCGNRVFNHLRADKNADIDVVDNDSSSDISDILPPKLERIRAIRNAGHEVHFVIHRYGLDEKTAFEVEAALIQAYPGLTNEIGGHHSAERGITDYHDLIEKYALPKLDLRENAGEKLILIKINKLQSRKNEEEIARLVRYCWRININRAECADYVLAVHQGIICGAYEPVQSYDKTDKAERKWLRATPENFPDIPYADGSESHRFGFKARKAPPEIWDKYVGEHGKRLDNTQFQKAQNPIFYLY